MLSVQNGNVEMFKLLIDNGALPSINTPNNVQSYVNICMHVYMVLYVICA
jgi:hypothetical protein